MYLDRKCVSLELVFSAEHIVQQGEHMVNRAVQEAKEHEPDDDGSGAVEPKAESTIHSIVVHHLLKHRGTRVMRIATFPGASV